MLSDIKQKFKSIWNEQKGELLNFKANIDPWAVLSQIKPSQAKSNQAELSWAESSWVELSQAVLSWVELSW